MQSRMLYASPNIATAHRLVKLDRGPRHFSARRVRRPAPSLWKARWTRWRWHWAWTLSRFASRTMRRPILRRDCRGAANHSASATGWRATDSAGPTGTANRAGFAMAMCSSGMAWPRRSIRRTGEGVGDRASQLDGAGSVRGLVQTASQDIGTGTYTVMTQVAADALGLPVDRVRFECGDSRDAAEPGVGRIANRASTGSAVHVVCTALRQRLAELAVSDGDSPLHSSAAADVRRQAGDCISR